MAGPYRRGRVFWARVQRQGRDIRFSLKTTNRAVAEKRFRDWLAERDGTAWGDKPRHTYAKAEERFIREHLTTLKPKSALRYGVSLKNLAGHFGDKTLDQITRSTLSEFETARRTDGVRPGTIRRDLACLSSLMTSAIDWEWVDDGGNPVPGYLRRRAKRGLKEAPGRTRYLTEAEEAKLLEHATHDVRNAITLAIDTGLRLEEMFGLKWSQVEHSRGTITTTSRTKSGRMRKVPLPLRARTIVGTLPRYLECPHVLVNPDTETRYVNMTKGLKAAMRRARIIDLRWQDLRRTAGCRWLQRDRRRHGGSLDAARPFERASDREMLRVPRCRRGCRIDRGRTKPGTRDRVS